MYHDPYDVTQIKAYRRDPTGRWSPIVEEEIDSDSAIFLILCGVLSAIIFAYMLYWGI